MLAVLVLAFAQVAEPSSEPLVRALEQARAALERARSAEATRDEEAARRAVSEGLGLLADFGDSAEAESLNFALAGVARRTGDLAATREGWERCRVWREEHLEPDDPAVQEIRTNVAVVLKETGDFEGALALEEQVLEVCERTLPEEHRFRMAARNNLALTLCLVDDLVRARTLLERELASREHLLPAGDPRTLTVLESLARVLNLMGDKSAARIMLERVVESLQEMLARPDLSVPGNSIWTDGVVRNQLEGQLCGARSQLGHVLGSLGARQQAREQSELVLAWREEHLPPGNLDLAQARLFVAGDSTVAGDWERAALQLDLAAEEIGLTQPPQSRQFLPIEALRTSLLLSMGDCDEALPRARELSARLAELDEGDSYWALDAAEDCLEAAVCSGEEELAPWIDAVVAGIDRVLRRGLTSSAREASELAWEIHGGNELLMRALELVPEDRELPRTVFELIESARDLTVRGSGLALEQDPEADLLRGALRDARERVASLVVELDGGQEGATGFASELAAAVLARDRAEQRLAERLIGPSRGRIVDLREVAAALGRDEACAAYWVWRKPIDPRRFERTRDRVQSLSAHVVRPDGELVRVDLGPLEDVEAAVVRWRSAIGRPVGSHAGARGLGAAPGSEAADDAVEVLAAGEALRRKVLDPVLRAAGTIRTLYICSLDVLELVPLDALPLGEGVVGDRVRVVLETSAARLAARRAASSSEPLLLALGGLEYGSPSGARGADDPPRPSISREAELTSRLGVFGGFPDLPASGDEVRAIGAVFEDAFDSAPRILTGAEGDKQHLIELAPRARFLHVATHGYVAGAEQLAFSEAWFRSGVRLSPEDAAIGLAPMALCGLALAGANAGADATGRMNGVITAEELAGLDLSGCELAVLSACDTNVNAGLRRMGLAVQSLRAALHAAGVRTSISTLWSIDDEPAREFATAFYRSLWIEKLPKGTALWRAKELLRTRGAPLRDWAAWVLTGDPQ